MAAHLKLSAAHVAYLENVNRSPSATVIGGVFGNSFRAERAATMNHRHATSLALVGWYFMAPPFTALNEPRLSQWDVIGSFDTATVCEKARKFTLDKISDPQFQAWTKANAEKHGQKFAKKAGDQRTLSSRCVSSDDPRLKSK